ncbi:MAG: type II toxin-antitoxin system Phd/YefM family antitoxin [Gammaproteobacteria bacterium]|nr:type II toxin-antitoxin system Phd/YefM family antitoxin [Gammaproteobacteria bacterium]
MNLRVSKSRFKARALEYFRRLEAEDGELIVTDRGKPVLKITRYREEQAPGLGQLKGSVLKYDEPEQPVGMDDWENA